MMASSVTTRGKADKKNIVNGNKKSVIHQLSDLFGSVLNIQIIESVARSCNYNVEMCSHHLLEMTSSVDNRNANGDSDQVPVEKSNVSNAIESIPTSVSDGFLNQNLNQQQLKPSVDSVDFYKPQKQKDLEKVITTISQGYRILILMRGLPGSGKSYLAKFIIDATIGQGNYKDHIFSTDDYFMKNGRYVFEGSKISEAHGWNHNRALKAMSQGVSPVIIDNTNTQLWEMRPYAMMAVDYGYYIEILEPNTPWCFNAKELTRRNKHNVPRQGINDMLLRYQKNVTGYDLLCAYNLRYSKNKPPMFRNQPPLTYGSNWFSCSNLTTSVQSLNDCSSKFTSILSSSLPQINELATASETINLMDFNEESVKSPAEQPIIIEDEDEDEDVHIVDDILTCSPVNESGILKPYLINTSTCDTQVSRNSNFSLEKSLQNIETAWGISEKALHSWDIVTPIQDIQTKPQEVVVEEETLVETKESSSNTENRDFDLHKTDSLPNGFRIIHTQNRDINRGIPMTNQYSVPKKLKLDKSCSVDYVDVDTEMVDTTDHIEHLKGLFPTIPKKYLMEIYQKCKGDLNWTIDVLLESQIIIDDEDDHEVEIDVSSKVLPEAGHRRSSQENMNATNRRVSEIEAHIQEDNGSDVKHYSRCPESQRLSSRAVSDAKNGPKHAVPSSKTVVTHYSMQECKPSTSKSEPFINLTNSDSDSSVDSDSESNNSSQTMELNLGDVLISQLEKRFENELPGYPKGFQPVVQIPVSLAKQLFALYLESVYQQSESQNKIIDGLVKQDEELAKQLNEQERKNTESQKENVLSFCEIMDEQVAQNLHNRDINQWKNLTPDTLAAKMTQQKLFNSFPTIDRTVIIEILHAHDNDYSATVESLLNSAPTHCLNGSPNEVKQPPISKEVISEMKHDVQNYTSEGNYYDKQTAEQYRQEAQVHLGKRNELYQKAQSYLQRGMTEVAQFYSEMAKKQTGLLERANSMAASSFIQEHSKRLQSFDTLDLHYLYAKEALSALDMFIDRNINLLRESNENSTQQLMIITGRGKNSENGISRLKPVVIGRLKKRNINYYKLNPGLLKIKISKNSLMASDIP